MAARAFRAEAGSPTISLRVPRHRRNLIDRAAKRKLTWTSDWSTRLIFLALRAKLTPAFPAPGLPMWQNEMIRRLG